MNNTYEQRQVWADQHWPLVWETIEQHMMRGRSEYNGKAYDFPTLRVKAIDGPRHTTANPVCVVINDYTGHGFPSEWQKIMGGDGDWLFFGSLDSDQTGWNVWHLIDLHVVRSLIAKPDGLQRHTRSLSHPDKGHGFLLVLTTCREAVIASSNADLDPTGSDEMEAYDPDSFVAA